MTNELAETTVQRDEWKRIAEDRGIELERLRADISQAYDLRDKAEGRYCTALGAIEQLHAAVKTAQELAATRLMEIERLSKREKTLMDVIDSRDRALGFVPLDDALHPGPSISKAFANSPRRVSDEPLQGASFPGQLGELYNAIAGYEKLSGYAPALLSAMRQLGASRDASPADLIKSGEIGSYSGWVDASEKSDEIRDLACCDKFIRESASEFCATCGYTNLDHLRKRSSQRT